MKYLFFLLLLPLAGRSQTMRPVTDTVVLVPRMTVMVLEGRAVVPHTIRSMQVRTQRFDGRYQYDQSLYVPYPKRANVLFFFEDKSAFGDTLRIVGIAK